METENTTEVIDNTNERPVELDGVNFSRGPSKPVPLKPRPRTRPQSAPNETHSKVTIDTTRHSAPPNVADEIDGDETKNNDKPEMKEKRNALSGFKKLFKKPRSKSEKKTNSNESGTIIEVDEK